MKWLITGLNGTLAPALAQEAVSSGAHVLGWDRGAVPPEDEPRARAWLAAERPDAIAHLAMGGVQWARLLAEYAAEHEVPLLFTSTAMVFHHQPDGPHRIGDERTAQDPYGQYKRDCEDAVLSACAHACVARIGWQIDPHRKGNNMLMALDQWQAKDGRIAASEAWRPACSFMQDTAAALVRYLRERVSGVRHVDSNADEGHSFVAIVRALKEVYRRDAWVIDSTQAYVHDQRLIGGGEAVPALSARLAPLKRAATGDA